MCEYCIDRYVYLLVSTCLECSNPTTSQGSTQSDSSASTVGISADIAEISDVSTRRSKGIKTKRSWLKDPRLYKVGLTKGFWLHISCAWKNRRGTVPHHTGNLWMRMDFPILAFDERWSSFHFCFHIFLYLFCFRFLRFSSLSVLLKVSRIHTRPCTLRITFSSRRWVNPVPNNCENYYTVASIWWKVFMFVGISKRYTYPFVSRM